MSRGDLTRYSRKIFQMTHPTPTSEARVTAKDMAGSMRSSSRCVQISSGEGSLGAAEQDHEVAWHTPCFGIYTSSPLRGSLADLCKTAIHSQLGSLHHEPVTPPLQMTGEDSAQVRQRIAPEYPRGDGCHVFSWSRLSSQSATAIDCEGRGRRYFTHHAWRRANGDNENLLRPGIRPCPV